MVLAAALVSACGISNIGFQDTKATTKVTGRKGDFVRPLELPPPMVAPSDQPPRANYATQVDTGGGGLALSSAPQSSGGAYIRIGSPPAEVQLKVLSFWRNLGVPLARSDPRTGTIETAWLPDYADRALGDGAAQKTMDRFTVVVEQGSSPSVSHIFLRHEGRYDAGPGQDSWTDAPTNIRLENLLLEQLQAYLSV